MTSAGLDESARVLRAAASWFDRLLFRAFGPAPVWIAAPVFVVFTTGCAVSDGLASARGTFRVTWADCWDNYRDQMVKHNG